MIPCRSKLVCLPQLASKGGAYPSGAVYGVSTQAHKIAT
jgi:hypothetical protein